MVPTWDAASLPGEIAEATYDLPRGVDARSDRRPRQCARNVEQGVGATAVRKRVIGDPSDLVEPYDLPRGVDAARDGLCGAGDI